MLKLLTILNVIQKFLYKKLATISKLTLTSKILTWGVLGEGLLYTFMQKKWLNTPINFELLRFESDAPMLRF
jgi:hypothetical protein